MKRMFLTATAAALTLSVAVALTQALAAGGLSMSPAILEHAAAPGAIGDVEVSNTTAGPLAITVTPRPWSQARSGAVAPNRRKTLSQVRASATSFTLAAGAQRTVSLTLLSKPSAGSLFGSLEIIGKPPAAKPKRAGIVAAYRLVGSLRLQPADAQRKLRVTAGSLRITGKGAKRAIAIALKNAGNTIDPISGTARLTGSRGSRSVALTAKRVVPGASIDLGLGRTKGLPKGRYRARVALFQAGKPVLTTTRTFRIR
jgi:hypothetical protein